MLFLATVFIALSLLDLCTASPDMLIWTERTAPMPTPPPSGTLEEVLYLLCSPTTSHEHKFQLREWKERLASRLMEASYNYRSSHHSELQHAHSVIKDLAVTVTYHVPAYVTGISVLRAVAEPPVWFGELPADVQSIKLEEGRAMYSIWTEAVAWMNHAPSGFSRRVYTGSLPTSINLGMDMESALDAIGAALSTASLSMIGYTPSTTATTGDVVSVSSGATTTMGGTVTSSSKKTATSTSDEGEQTGITNTAGKGMVGVAVAMIAGLAVTVTVLL
jgi:hypothetical protein